MSNSSIRGRHSKSRTDTPKLLTNSKDQIPSEGNIRSPGQKISCILLKRSFFVMLTGVRCWFLFCTSPQRIYIPQQYLLPIQTFRSPLCLRILRSGLSDQLSVCISTCYMFCPPHPYCAHCTNNTSSGHRFMWLSV